VLPPATPKDRVEILQEAMRKVFKGPEFRAASSSMLKKFSGVEPLPSR
jgi:tripartite-type tricarboxylate transporter receptor subunit TctC